MREIVQTLRSAESKLRDRSRRPRAPQAHVYPSELAPEMFRESEGSQVKKTKKELSDSVWKLPQLGSWQVSKAGQPNSAQRLPLLPQLQASYPLSNCSVFPPLSPPASASSPHPTRSLHHPQLRLFPQGLPLWPAALVTVTPQLLKEN